MSEEAYQRESAEVSLKLSQPHVRDVWEERMPLALEAALSAGCVASVAPAVRDRPLSEGYDLVELQVCVSKISSMDSSSAVANSAAWEVWHTQKPSGDGAFIGLKSCDPAMCHCHHNIKCIIPTCCASTGVVRP